MESKKPKVLIFGWYSHDNLGDQYFKDAFRALFPDFALTFTDILRDGDVLSHDALIFGGGSFLDQKPPIKNGSLSGKALKHLGTIPVFFLGVGAETNIHPFYLPYLEEAKLIALRSEAKSEYLKTLNPKVVVACDLVYSLTPTSSLLPPKSKSVLVLPNIACLPQYTDPYWKHVHWESFKLEFAQFLDVLIDDGWSPLFFPMCRSDVLDDDWAATEIVAKMKHRSSLLMKGLLYQDFEDVLNLASSFEAVITQRYHGKILADIAGRKCLTISHHDKLNVSNSLSYYALNKTLLRERFDALSPASLPLNSNSWKSIAKQVSEIVVSSNDKMGRSQE